MSTHDAPGHAIDADVIDYAFALIQDAPSWTDPVERRGHFFGLTEGWTHAGIINYQQRAYLQEQLETVLGSRTLPVLMLPAPRPTFWRRFLAWRVRRQHVVGADDTRFSASPSYSFPEAIQSPSAPPPPVPANTP